MTRLGYIKGSTGRTAALMASVCGLLLLAAPSASARWTIHNDADVTQILAPPGGVEGETCADRVRGQAGWAASDSSGTYVPPPLAYDPVLYDIWTKPRGAPNGGEIVQTDAGVEYRLAGVPDVPAVFVKHFTTSRRHAVTPPYLIPNLSGLYLFTIGTFYTALPSYIDPGDPVGVKPTATGSDFLTLTAISCSPAAVRIDVLPGVSPNNVDPKTDRATLAGPRLRQLDSGRPYHRGGAPAERGIQVGRRQPSTSLRRRPRRFPRPHVLLLTQGDRDPMRADQRHPHRTHRRRSAVPRHRRHPHHLSLIEKGADRSVECRRLRLRASNGQVVANCVDARLIGAYVVFYS